uniref:Uncharacterized protein n=1 Tax=Molossus molossus TaxID=27622 RepID=A0A7J8EF31_MOLMO|nr:hypothetical protein HJG59_008843 [Molossus molossus]
MGLPISPSRALGITGRPWTRPWAPAGFGGGVGEPPECLGFLGVVLPHTQKTYHPTLLARFQSLMTFVNHQPVCLHQQTLPTDTPFHTKAVAIPFKRGSLKAPLCSSEENKISSLRNFKPLEITQQKPFCCVSCGKLEPGLHNINNNDGSAPGKQGTFGVKSSTRDEIHLSVQSSNTLVSSEAVKDSNFSGCRHTPTVSLFCFKGDRRVMRSEREKIKSH